MHQFALGQEVLLERVVEILPSVSAGADSAGWAAESHSELRLGMAAASEMGHSFAYVAWSSYAGAEYSSMEEVVDL